MKGQVKEVVCPRELLDAESEQPGPADEETPNGWQGSVCGCRSELVPTSPIPPPSFVQRFPRILMEP